MMEGVGYGNVAEVAEVAALEAMARVEAVGRENTEVMTLGSGVTGVVVMAPDSAAPDASDHAEIVDDRYGKHGQPPDGHSHSEVVHNFHGDRGDSSVGFPVEPDPGMIVEAPLSPDGVTSACDAARDDAAGEEAESEGKVEDETAAKDGEA